MFFFVSIPTIRSGIEKTSKQKKEKNERKEKD
jgi:hypothetical protein